MVDVEDLQEASIPKDRTEILKWNGWGYNDTQFELGNAVRVVSFVVDGSFVTNSCTRSTLDSLIRLNFH